MKINNKMSMDATALPSELLVMPQPFIGFSGLDINDSIHQTIWDAFNSNRKPDRIAINFKLLPSNYEFPISKPKRQSYEWYHPKGILKRNWMLKHLHVLPACVVLFEEIEWNDSQWSEKQLQCAATVQSLKNSLQGRNTKLAIVLLQKSAPLPAGDDLIASERAACLTSACGISAKMLFVLPYNEHLMGYTLRLESAFLEMAQSYYAQMSKQVRVHRDQLTASHQTLKIRHQFKLGFISEMRLDNNTALKHYTQAYGNLEECRIVDINCLEIKTIAGFLNFKISKLMFKLNAPRDAITQFKSHIDKYKSRVGFKELLFEHYAWLSVQYSAFAELFCEAVKNGLPALQTQHPGIYFHKSAEYITKRKEAFLQSCSLSLLPTKPSSPTTQKSNATGLFGEFFGIRTIKTCESVSEQQLISLVHENERNFNHSSAIISLLGQAMAQFKVYKCLRFRKKLAIDMAEEYFKCGDHAKALTLFSLMLTDYRQDNWYTIFTEVLLKTLRLAFLSASVKDFIECSIEVLSSKIRCKTEERIVVLENLWKVFQNVPPISQSQISAELELRTHWETSLASFKSPIIIDLNKISDLFDCAISFVSPQIKSDENIHVKLFIRSSTDIPLKLRNLRIVVTDSKQILKITANKFYSFEKIIDFKRNEKDANNSYLLTHPFNTDFQIEPMKFYTIFFDQEYHEFTENVELQILRLEFEMGSDENFAILTKSNNPSGHKNYKNYNQDFMDNIIVNSSCYVVPTFHLTTHNSQGMQPMLTNEFCKVISNVSNAYNISLQNVVFSVSVPNRLRNKVFLTTDLMSRKQKLLSQIQIDIGELEQQANTLVSYYVFSLIEGNLELQQKVWYNLDSPRPIVTTPVSNNSSTDNSPSNDENEKRKIISQKFSRKISCNIRIDYIGENIVRKVREDIIIQSCTSEFKFNGRFYALNRQPLLNAYRGEDFLLRINFDVMSPACGIEILETYFISDPNLQQSSYSFKRKKHTNIYNKYAKVEDVILLRSNVTTYDWLTQKKHSVKSNQTEIFKINRNISNPLPGNSKIENANNANLMLTFLNPVTTSLTTSSSKSLMISSTISDDGKLSHTDNDTADTNAKSTPKIIFNRAKDALQATGHGRGFIKGITTLADNMKDANATPIFGVYCIKWRRSGNSMDENESKFLIHGVKIEEASLNIYSHIEDVIFVKVPMTYKISIRNRTAKIIHLIVTLSNSEIFMCSGHKQLNVSIFSHSIMEIVYNLYPLKPGWQLLPELSLEYNTQMDGSHDNDIDKIELRKSVERSMPKKVFILPPIRQQPFIKIV